MRFYEEKSEVEKLIMKHNSLIDAMVEKDKQKIVQWMEDHLLDTNVTVMNAYLKNKGEKIK